jgi:hypothetical protein
VTSHSPFAIFYSTAEEGILRFQAVKWKIENGEWFEPDTRFDRFVTRASRLITNLLPAPEPST